MMLMERLTLRGWYLLVFLACVGLLAYALWLQHRMFLDPCPLCLFQRVAFAWIGAWALLAAIHDPDPPAPTRLRKAVDKVDDTVARLWRTGRLAA